MAFDPDWTALDADQVDLLERWVAEKAGGLIVRGRAGRDRPLGAGPQAGQDPRIVSGRVQSPADADGRRPLWLRDALAARVHPRRARGRVSLAGRQRSGQPAGLGVVSPACSATTACTAPKPGATVYARYLRSRSRPAAASCPVYMAGQFYGSGRVFYLGSGEMWRLRAIDESYFEQFYTKLMRHVSQGRLLVGSSRGMLLVDRDRYLLGGTVVVRAQLSNSQFEPLDDAAA